MGDVPDIARDESSSDDPGGGRERAVHETHICLGL